MAKTTLNDLSGLTNPNTVVSTINANNDRIEAAFDNTLSRNGSSPNQMESNLDMNSYRIVNLPEPIHPTEPIRKADADHVLSLADEFETAIDQVAADVVTSAANAAAADADATSAAASAAAALAALGTIGAIGLDTLPTRASAITTDIDFAVLSLRTNGYYTLGDGGGALYKRVTSEPNHTGKFRSVDRYLPDGSVSAGNGGWWEYCPEGPILAEQFGVRTGLGNENSAELAGVLSYASGRKVILPIGLVRITSTVNVTVPYNIEGHGNGGGPGVVDTTNATIVYCDFANATAIQSTTNYFASTVRNVQFNQAAAHRPSASGAALIMVDDFVPGVDDPNPSYLRVDNCLFDGFHRQIFMTNSFCPSITRSIFGNWVADAIYSAYGGRETSGGFITNNTFFGGITGTQTSCINLRNGYTIVQANFILGAQYGIKVEIADHPAGFIHIVDNTIEEQYYKGVYISSIAPGSVDGLGSMFTISRNEFANLFTTTSYTGAIQVLERADDVDWLVSCHIKDNIIQSTCGAGGCLIDVSSGSGVSIVGNTLREFGAGAPLGIRLNPIVVDNIGTNNRVMDNVFIGDGSNFTAKYLLKAGVIFRSAE